jgi:hypothetical protein
VLDYAGSRPTENEGPVMTPTKGEGAPEDDWDDLSPRERVSRALADLDDALEHAQAAPSEAEASRWRGRAASLLSSVRADIVREEGGIERYAELEARVEQGSAEDGSL